MVGNIPPEFLSSLCLPPAPPVHPAVIGDLAFAGEHIQGLFSLYSNGPGGTSVPTPLAVMKGLFSCEFPAQLQELCLHGSQCLFSLLNKMIPNLLTPLLYVCMYVVKVYRLLV